MKKRTVLKSGMWFTANDDNGMPVRGKITIEDDSVYLCQNFEQGDSCEEKQGYACSWNAGRHRFVETINAYIHDDNFTNVRVYIGPKAPALPKKSSIRLTKEHEARTIKGKVMVGLPVNFEQHCAQAC